MNHKRKCYDLDKTLAGMALPIRVSISAERDRYLQHHRGFGGAAWVYLNNAADSYKVIRALSSLPGVESVLAREAAASRYSLYSSRIGDICVFGPQRYSLWGIGPDKHRFAGYISQPRIDV
jgi:phosphonoacetate hydrolase